MGKEKPLESFLNFLDQRLCKHAGVDLGFLLGLFAQELIVAQANEYSQNMAQTFAMEKYCMQLFCM